MAKPKSKPPAMGFIISETMRPAKFYYDSGFSLIIPSWHAMRRNLITLLELIIIPEMLYMLGGRFITITQANPHAPAVIHFHPWFAAVEATAFLVALVFAPAQTLAILKSARGDTIDFLEALRLSLPYFWKYVEALFLSFLIILAGCVAFIVPGAFMLRRYYLTPYYVIDRRMGAREALATCSRECRDAPLLAVLGIIGVQLLFGLSGLVPIVGWACSLSLGFIFYAAAAIRYLEFSRDHGIGPGPMD